MQNRGFSPAERYSLNFKEVRGRGRKRDYINNAQQAYPQSTDIEDDYNSSRGRHPPGLRGKEIGLWYARRNRNQQEKQRSTNTSSLFMDGRREENIRQLLSSLQKRPEFSPGSSETCPVPVGSYSSSSSHKLEEDHENHRLSHKLNTDVKTVDIKDEPPDSWDMENNDSDAMENTDIGKDFEMVELSNSGDTNPDHNQATAPLTSQDELILDEYNDDDLDVPSVVSLVEYMKSHGDYPYIGQEPEADFVLDQNLAQNKPEVDSALKLSLQQLVTKEQYISMLDFRKKLPCYGMRDVIVNTIRENQVLVISGETGCGKTTQVPQFILDDSINREQGSQCKIICTQPRRISAISVAERVAAERCERLDSHGTCSVGYQIRLESKLPRSHGSILFCTTGIVLKFLESDPNLSRATHIIIDEIHERDLQSDFLMIILKDLILRRSDLRVILMSATLNAEMFSAYFNNCPMLQIPGQTFPVKEYLLEDIIELTRYQPDDMKRYPSCTYRRGKLSGMNKEELQNYEVWCRNLFPRYGRKTIEILQSTDFSKIDLDLVVHIISYICLHMQDGAILIFVPGWEDIKRLHGLIQKTLSRIRSGSFRIIPLHSLMPTVNQRDVFERPPPGVRKIVIATNIAETSITIDDVVFVVDCGKIKVKNFQPEMNLSSLDTQWVSKANSKQRRGRAGRVQPGHCFHLFTEFHHNCSQDYLPPEMLRTRLEELCLQIKLLKLGKIVPFISKAMQHPSLESITHAVETLVELNALDSDENLLPLGYHLARLPVEPHTGKMILFGAMFCCLDPILTVAASLSFKDAFTIPMGKENLADEARKRLAEESRSDHIMLINAFKGWEESKRNRENRTYCWNNFLSENTLKMLLEMKKQLANLLYDVGFLASQEVKYPQSNINSKNLGLIKAVLCAGFYPNVAEIVKVPNVKSSQYKTVSMLIKDHTKVMAHPKSVNSRQTYFDSVWMVYYYKLKTKKVYIHDSTMVSPYPLLFFGGNIQITKDKGQELVCVDDWIKFKATASTAQLVKDLRCELDKLLTHKITNPGPTIWDNADSEGAIMNAIVDLIAGEEKGYAKFGSRLGGSIGKKP